MQHRFRLSLCTLSIVLLVFAAAPWSVALASKETALDRYIAKADPNYAYQLHSTLPGEGFTAYVIDMTSQSWRTEKEVDRTLWKHWVMIIVPAEVKFDTSLLFIGGGSNNNDAPTKVDGMMAQIAMATQSVVTSLSMIPNQPLTFIADDTRPRKEDALIAYTWDKYLRGGDEEWPARLPMTKSAVRAMDTVTDFCASEAGGAIPVSKFMVAGGSKRGWTTWTTAAVDKRVVAIAPIVIDLLNVVPSFEHHWKAYGFWAPSVGDYVEMGIMDWMGSPEYDRLMAMVDPYSYRKRLTMPKFLINATGDQFFLPDSWKFYLDDLVGPTYQRYVPNGDHGLDGTDAPESLTAFYGSVLTAAPRPEYKWKLKKDGSIRVTTKTKPLAVKLWQATNPDTRDFRKELIGPAWTSTDLEGKDGVYIGQVPVPEKGWTAFLVELTYESMLTIPYKFSTGVHVLPDTLPFPYEAPKR
jgi:PhoPQ-activated pathogenicity-related protein